MPNLDMVMKIWISNFFEKKKKKIQIFVVCTWRLFEKG